MRDYRTLKKFCNTSRQAEVIDSLIKTESLTKTASQLGVTKQTISDCIKSVERHAEKRGMLGKLKQDGAVPDGFFAETSVKRRLNPDTGQMEVIEDWTKSRKERGNAENLYRQFIEGLCADIIPAKKTKAPKSANPDLASAVIFGDAHIGMLAHAVETLAEDYNLEKGTADIRAAIDYCVDCAPESEEGWFINVGDMMHVDNTNNTTTGGTKQDTSAYHGQILRAAGALTRYCIDKMLTKFKTVRAVNARGNHDNDSALAFSMYLEGIYENEPRVIVLSNDSKFNFIEFGVNLIGINHGDKINHERLAGVMTRTQAAAWGRTSFRRWWTGHIHHKKVLEHASGITFESFHTLAPVEVWHAASGYGAERRVTMITIHKKHGEVNRMSPSVEMVRQHAA